jgi:hypothetical protein
MTDRLVWTVLGILSLYFGTASAGVCSDWIEDSFANQKTTQAATTTPAEDDLPPVAPSRATHVAQGGYLTGSASIVGRGSGQIPVVSPLNGFAGQSDADNQRLVINTSTNQVIPPSSLQGWLQRTHPEFNLAAQTNPDAVVEVKGAWDNSSQILKAMGIRYHEIKAKELRDFSLMNTKVVVINCEGKVPVDAMEPLRQWVIHGGYLISTDWTLGNVVQRAFPGMVAFDGYKTKGTTVDAQITGSEPDLLAGTRVARATWKLDEESQALRVLNPRVHVLVRSGMLSEMDPCSSASLDYNQRGALAVHFPYGRGAVLHLVGHFDYNAPVSAFLRYILPDAIPGAGIGLRQAIATNFLIQALERERVHN